MSNGKKGMDRSGLFGVGILVGGFMFLIGCAVGASFSNDPTAERLGRFERLYEEHKEKIAALEKKAEDYRVLWIKCGGDVGPVQPEGR